MVGRYGPHNPDETYVPHKYPGAALRHRRGRDELRDRRRAVEPGAAADPRPDRVLVGLRGGDGPPEGQLPALRSRPARPGPLGPHAGPLHARQHGQRPGAVHPGRHQAGRPWSAGSRRAGCFRPGSRPTRRRAWSAPATTRTRRCSPPRSTPACGQGIRQTIGPIFAMYAKYLGDQWSVGDWAGLRRQPRPTSCPPGWPACPRLRDEPPQSLKEYDPEWGRAFWTGTVAASCDHARMLKAVKVPVLFTHHFRRVDETTGLLMGAISDVQVGAGRANWSRPPASRSTTARSRRWATPCTARTRRCSPRR